MCIFPIFKLEIMLCYKYVIMVMSGEETTPAPFSFIGRIFVFQMENKIVKMNNFPFLIMKNIFQKSHIERCKVASTPII